ncbi:hypothetical protein WJX72_001054 [[Myrmecia] bisecta]|uniref:Uncharacterized protein n=1 Tax=[Myrmecia] bisecta TaxID=41462 RepID=A0AAW1PR81_9CHLO
MPPHYDSYDEGNDFKAGFEDESEAGFEDQFNAEFEDDTYNLPQRPPAWDAAPRSRRAPPSTQRAAPPASRSDKLRQEGNDVYLSLGEGLPSIIYKQRLLKAIDLYKQAVACARGDEELSSAHRNCGQAMLRLAQRDATLADRLDHYCTALHHFSTALGVGLACKHRDWCQAIEETLESCQASVFASLPLADPSVQRRWLERIAVAASERLPAFRAEKWMQLADYVYKCGICVLDSAPHECLKEMCEAHRPAEEALRWAREAHWTPAAVFVTELQHDIYVHQCICESVKARESADEILLRSLTESETLDMEAVWLAIDLYHQAAILTRERAEILETLKRLQAEVARQEELEKSRERAPILEALRDELEAVTRAAVIGAHKLVEHIYTVHPPKIPKHKRPDMSPDNMKKGLLAAITPYHPDKQRAGEHSAEWCVLAEEICKALNVKYGMFTCACE